MARRLAWVFFSLACALVLVQCVSLVERGSEGESDVGVFYRTARLLDAGVGAELYERRDAKTGWPIAIPPAGMAFFQAASRLGPFGMTLAWAALNIGLAVCALGALRGLVSTALFPWVGGVFLVLASGSVQVGQFSLMFVACWVLALRLGWPAPWALPAAIKLYPALMFFTPASAAKDRRRALVAGTWCVAWLLVLFFLVPFMFYGLRAWELNASFVEHVVVDPSGRVKWMQALGTTANQSLDAVMIRYLSWYPKFHEQYALPTARLDLDTVRQLAHIVRLAVVGATVFVLWRARLRSAVPDLLTSAAVWSATLYLVLPETRARYAVYTLLAFVLLAAHTASLPPGRSRAWAFAGLGACLMLVMGAVPKQAEVLGLGFLGPVALWVFSLRALRSPRPSGLHALRPEGSPARP